MQNDQLEGEKQSLEGGLKFFLDRKQPAQSMARCRALKTTPELLLLNQASLELTYSL